MSAQIRKQRGFTLVELLVVITIIAILSVIGITVFTGVQKAARDAKRKGDLHAISLTLEQYKTVNGTYPISNAFSDQTNPWTTFGSLLSPLYMTQIPYDPKQSSGPCSCGVDWYVYGYVGLNNGAGYRLCANLENNSDPARNMDAPSATSNPPAISCDTGTTSGNKWGDYRILNQQ